MPRRFISRFSVSKDYVLHLVVALEHADSALKERIAERCIDDIGRIVPQHLGHVLIHDIPIDLLKPDHIFLGEISAMPIIESPYNLR